MVELIIPSHFLLFGICRGGRQEWSLPLLLFFWLTFANSFFLFTTGFCGSSKKRCIMLHSSFRPFVETDANPSLSPRKWQGLSLISNLFFHLFYLHSFCFSWQTTESRVNFVILRQPGVQLSDPVEDGSTSNNSSSSSNGGSPVHHRRRLDQNHYRRKSTYQKVSFVRNGKSAGYSWSSRSIMFALWWWFIM